MTGRRRAEGATTLYARTADPDSSESAELALPGDGGRPTRAHLLAAPRSAGCNVTARRPRVFAPGPCGFASTRRPTNSCHTWGRSTWRCSRYRRTATRVRRRVRCLMRMAESWGYLPPQDDGEERDPEWRIWERKTPTRYQTARERPSEPLERKDRRCEGSQSRKAPAQSAASSSAVALALSAPNPPRSFIAKSQRRGTCVIAEQLGRLASSPMRLLLCRGPPARSAPVRSAVAGGAADACADHVSALVAGYVRTSVMTKSQANTTIGQIVYGRKFGQSWPEFGSNRPIYDEISPNWPSIHQN